MGLGFVLEGEAMQREATRSGVPRRRGRRRSALCALCLAPWLVPAAVLAGDGPDVSKYGQKGPTERDEEAELDPYAGWLSESFEDADNLGRFDWNSESEPAELDPSDWLPDTLAATETGGSSPCVITLKTTVPASGTKNQVVDMSVKAEFTAPAPAKAVIGRFDIDYGDGSKESFVAPAGTSLQNPFPFKHTYTLEGWYSVTVNAIGSVQGVVGTTCRASTFYGLHTTLQIKPDTGSDSGPMSSYQPSISVSPAGPYHVGDELTFTAATGMPPAVESRYWLDFRWTMGDGSEARGRTVTRSYMQPVSHTVAVEVYAYTGTQWEKVGARVSTPVEVKRGVEVVGFVPQYMGRIRDLAYSEFVDTTGQLQKIVWSVSSTKVAAVQVNEPRSPVVLGGLRTLQYPWSGGWATSVTGSLSVAATDKLVALSVAAYGIVLLDAQLAPFTQGAFKPFARVDAVAAVDLEFSADGKTLFAVTPTSIRVYDVSKWATGPRTLSQDPSAPMLASYSESASFTGLGVTPFTDLTGKKSHILFVGQARPMALDVFEYGDLDQTSGKDLLRRSQFVSNGTLTGGAMAPPRDFAVLGSVLAVNENWLTFGSPGYTAFYDLNTRDLRQAPAFRARQGLAQAGVAMLSHSNGPYAYSTDMAVAVEIDATVAGKESVVEMTELALGTTWLGRGSKVIADPHSDRLYVGATGSALVVLDVE